MQKRSSTSHRASLRIMPVYMDPALIKLYAAEFVKYEYLRSNGFSFLVNASGKLFQKKGKASLADVESNVEAGI